MKKKKKSKLNRHLLIIASINLHYLPYYNIRTEIYMIRRCFRQRLIEKSKLKKIKKLHEVFLF